MFAVNRAMTRSKAKTNKKRSWMKLGVVCGVCLVLAVVTVLAAAPAHAATVSFDVSDDGAGGLDSFRLLGLFILLTLAPTLLLMFSCFTRIVIVLSLVRNAIGLQNTPPNQVIVGLALFLSLFIMNPVLTELNEVALQPYMAQEISMTEAIDAAQVPLKEFMLKQTRTDDLNLFQNLSGREELATTQQEMMALSLTVITPAFITSEISRAFMIGFFLYLPFLVIDMVVSSTLMSIGMVMLPPSMISLPFKLMLFVVVDGWQLIMQMLVNSYGVA